MKTRWHLIARFLLLTSIAERTDQAAVRIPYPLAKGHPGKAG
ncbi:MAG: hypothetical protein P8184_20640 [Calditrichia bacterium]